MTSTEMVWATVALLAVAGDSISLAVDGARRLSGKRGASTASRRGSVEGALVATRSTGPRSLRSVPSGQTSARPRGQSSYPRRSDRMPVA